MLPLAPATSAVSELPPLSVRRCPGRGGLGSEGSCNLVTCPFYYGTYTNTSHAAPRPARKQGLPRPPPTRLCIPRRSSSHPLPYLGARRQPQV